MYISYIPWLLWIMLQWTWVYRYFFKIVVSFPLDVYPELELLDYDRAIFNFSRNLHTVFSSDSTSLLPYQACRSVCFSPHPHQHFLSLVFLIMDILLIILHLLCFPYVQWCGALFHVPITHFYVFFCKNVYSDPFLARSVCVPTWKLLSCLLNVVLWNPRVLHHVGYQS